MKSILEMNLWKNITSLPKELWMLSIAAFINRIGTMVLPFMAIYLNKVVHLSIAQSGLIITVYGIAAFITAPFIGKMVDKTEPLGIMKFSLVLSGILLFFFPYITKYYAIIGATFIWSVFNEAFRPANMVLISRLAEAEQRRLAFSLNRLAINLGMSVGPVLGGILFVYDYHLMFFTDGATSLLSCLFLIALPKKYNMQKEVEETVNINEEKKSIKLVNEGTLLLFLVAILPVFLVFAQHVSAMPIYITQELMYKETTYGMLFAINTIMIIIIEMPLINYLSKYHNLSLISAGSLFVAVGFGSMMFASNMTVLILTVVCWTIGEMIIFPSSAAYIAEIAPKEKQGKYMGRYQMANNAAFMIGPWLGTFVYEKSGSFILWSSAFAFGIISAVGIRVIQRKTKSATSF